MGYPASGLTFACCVLLINLIVRAEAENSCVFEYVEDCLTPEEEKDRLMDLRNLTVGVVEGGRWGILGLAHVNVETFGLVKMEFTKCASKQEPETCMYFSTMKYKDWCKKLVVKNAFWSPFFQNIEPPLRCPAKGDYDLKNAVLDLDYASQGLPGLVGFYWKVKTKIYQKGKKIGCLLTEVSTFKN